MNRKKLMIVIGFIAWPIIIAVPHTINVYVSKLLNSEIKFQELPQVDLALGLVSGLLLAFLLIGISYFLAYLLTEKKERNIFNGPFIFLVITCLGIILLTFSYGKRLVDTLGLEKENVEIIQKRLKKAKGN
jgi:hypothetical protein